jgi:hypothetical protein
MASELASFPHSPDRLLWETTKLVLDREELAVTFLKGNSYLSDVRGFGFPEEGSAGRRRGVH